MTTEKHDPWALLAEIHELQPWLSQDADLAARVEAALAALNPCRLIDVGDGGMSRERAEADAFKRGVAAMREAAARGMR
jgi:hypothetical protein